MLIGVTSADGSSYAYHRCKEQVRILPSSPYLHCRSIDIVLRMFGRAFDSPYLHR